MNRSALLLASIAFALSVAPARGAEDQSAHRPSAQPPATHEHSTHEEQATESKEASQHDEHSGHVVPERNTRSEPTESERNHVPPEPPQHPMHDMSNAEMIELMQMDDMSSFGMVLLDQLEWREVEDRDALVWDAQAWYGNDYTKLWLKSEGERVAGEYKGRAELYLDRVLARWWNLQVGVRRDFSEGPSWAGIGIQGLAPHWFEVEATAFVGEQGRVAAIFSGEYEILLTQRLVLQPKIEFDLYSKEDRDNGIGSGLADTELALRLRYEFRRELAPYVGIVWIHLYGQTADFARAAGLDTDDLQFVAGIRFWF